MLNRLRSRATFTCPDCKHPLKMVRTWRQVNWRCTGCGGSYDLGDLVEQMDEEMESAIAYLQCNRI